MKAKPSDIKASNRPLRESLRIPVLKVTEKASPSSKARNKGDISYGVDSLEKLINTAEGRAGSLKEEEGR